MILLENNSIQSVIFPKSASISFNFYDIEIYSEVTQEEYPFKNVIDGSDSYNYFAFVLNLTELPTDAEYRYRIKHNSFILEEGLLRIGEYRNNKTQYEAEPRYTEYKY